MEDLIKSIKNLENSKEFKDYKNKNKNSYLTSAFLMTDIDNWQIDYYNPTTRKLTSFLIRDKIKVKPESQALQEDNKTINELVINKIKIDYNKAIKIVDKFNKDKYPKEIPNKKIIVLQNLENYNHVWNITYITNSFKTLNVKINAVNGEIVSESLSSLINFNNS